MMPNLQVVVVFTTTTVLLQHLQSSHLHPLALQAIGLFTVAVCIVRFERTSTLGSLLCLVFTVAVCIVRFERTSTLR